MSDKNIQDVALTSIYMIKLYREYPTEMKPYLQTVNETVKSGGSRYANGNKPKIKKIHRDKSISVWAYLVVDDKLNESHFFAGSERREEITLQPNQILYTYGCYAGLVNPKKVESLIQGLVTAVVYLSILSITAAFAHLTSADLLADYMSRSLYHYTAEETGIAAIISGASYFVIMGIGFLCAHILSKTIKTKS